VTDDQLDLFGPPLARNTDPATSHMAARFAEPRAGTHRYLCLRLLRDHPEGLTDFDLAALTGLQQNSIGKRRTELRDAGFVEDSGRRRPAPSGALAIVWTATERRTHGDDGDPGTGGAGDRAGGPGGGRAEAAAEHRRDAAAGS